MLRRMMPSRHMLNMHGKAPLKILQTTAHAGPSQDSSSPFHLVYAVALGAVGVYAHTQQRPVLMEELPTRRLLQQRLSAVYQVNQLLGEGGFGQVSLGYHKASNTQVAIKKLKKNKVPEIKFRKEVDLLKEVGGKYNVIELREAFETDEHYVIVTEVAKGGELFDRLIENGTYAPRQAGQIMHETAAALAYLHTHDIVHADLKPENIVLMSKKDAVQLRLIDFGMAFRSSDDITKQPKFSKGSGTAAYSAPELLRGEAGTCAADMWSLGVVLYILLAGAHPFDLQNNCGDKEIKRRIMAGEYSFSPRVFQNVPQEVKDVIAKMLTQDPTQRISATELLQNEWVTRSAKKDAVVVPSSTLPETFEEKRHERRLVASLAALIIEHAGEGEDVDSASWLNAFLAEDSTLVSAALDKLDPAGKGYVDITDLQRTMKDLGGPEYHPNALREMIALASEKDPKSKHIQYVDVARLVSNLKCETFTKNEKIYCRGEKSDERIFVVLQGNVECTTEEGSSTISMGVMKAGNIFGQTLVNTSEEENIGNRLDSATCTSDDARVLVLTTEDLNDMTTAFGRVEAKINSESATHRQAMLRNYLASVARDLPGATHMEVKKNDVICEKGNRTLDTLYVVESGEFQVTNTKNVDDENQVAVVVETLKAGDFFPVGVYEADRVEEATVSCASEKATLIAVPGTTLRAYMEDNASSLLQSAMEREVQERRISRQHRALRLLTRAATRLIAE